MNDQSQGRCLFGYGYGAANGPAPAGSHSAIAPAMSRSQLSGLIPAPIEPGSDGLATGRCLCGTVRFRVRTPVERVFANHDAASRRWTGGSP